MAIPWIILFGLLWVVVIVLGVLVLGLSQRITLLETSAPATQASGDLSLFEDAPAVGTPVPNLGEHILAPLAERGNTAVLFLGSGCGPCIALAEKLSAVLGGPEETDSKILDDEDEIVVVTDPEGVSTFGRLGRVVVERDQEITRAFGVKGTPVGFGVDRDGIVRAATLLTSVEDVVRLADSCAPESAVKAQLAG